ncbi:MAG: ABC transporter transmembrane domain-containing protein, partial [Candidatus Thorarchaeota archaeon]
MSKHKTFQQPNQLIEFSPGKDYFKKSRKKGVRRWIFAHIFHKTNKIFIFIVLFTTVFASILASAISIFVGLAVTAFLTAGIESLIFYSTTILILGLMTPILRLLNFSLREILAQRLERDTRKEFYGVLLGKSQSFHDKQQIGDLMARATNDVRTLNFLISPAVSLIFESFTTLIIPIFFILFLYPIQLILEPIIFIILFFISLWRYTRKLGPVTGELRMNFGMINTTLDEALSGIEVVKASTQEKHELNKYLTFAKKYRDAALSQGKIQAKYMPILFLGITITIGLGHSLLLLNLGLINIGQVISYIGLLELLSF